MRILLTMALLLTGLYQDLEASQKWSSTLSPEWSTASRWKELIAKMQTKDTTFGAVAALGRMLIIFDDADTKAFAYRQLIEAAERGYPLPIDSYFTHSDFVPFGEVDFINTFHLYRAIHLESKGQSQWAQQHFSKISDPQFAKLLFYQAIQAYSTKRVEESEEKLVKILKSPQRFSTAFVKGVTRTLARIRFEQGRYQESLSLYTGFLLRTPTVAMDDFLEAAWNSFYLDRLPEAIGYLYNLQSHQSQFTRDLKEYLLRALIYKETCNTQAFSVLRKQFNSLYSKAIEELKSGTDPKSLSILQDLKAPGNIEYERIQLKLQRMQTERKLLVESFLKERRFIDYLYQSEIDILSADRLVLESEALERIAKLLITIDEQLKFLDFEIQRSSHDPDKVFALSQTTTAKNLYPNKKVRLVTWPQGKDFWRDERLTYQGRAGNLCR